MATASRPCSSSMLLHAHNSGSKRTQLEPHAAAGSRKLRSLHQKFACNKAEALMAENLSSDTPKFWHEQNLLRILTKRGRNALSPLSKLNIPLNLCLLCPYLTILNLRRTRRLCGGESSFSPTLASNMMYYGRKLKDLCVGKATFSPIYLKR